MTKKKLLTKAMKNDIMDIIKKYIKTNQPEYNDEKQVSTFLTETKQKMQEFIDNFEYPDNEEQKKIINKQDNKFLLRDTRNLTANKTLIKFDFDDEDNSKYVQFFQLYCGIKTFYTYNMGTDFLSNFDDKKDTKEYNIIKKVLEDNKNSYTNLYNCYCIIYRNLFADDFVLKYKKLKKQYRDIVFKFSAVVNNTKYINDLLDVINIPDVKTYIENYLKIKNTAISCINQETLDFVKNYLSTNKK